MVEGQDYAGALDLLDQLKALLQQPQLMGLQCLRHLPPRLQDIEAAVDQALAHDFLSRVTNSDIAQIAAQAASDAEAHPGGRHTTAPGVEEGGACWGRAGLGRSRLGWVSGVGMWFAGAWAVMHADGAFAEGQRVYVCTLRLVVLLATNSLGRCDCVAHK